jgi:hypothetical protein
MKIQERIDALVTLGEQIVGGHDPRLEEAIHRAKVENSWFSDDNIRLAVQAIAEEFLQEDKLAALVKDYHLDDHIRQRHVGLILAGNIPMVGFHDVLCTFITGHIALIKYAEKDRVLIHCILQMLGDIAPETRAYFKEVEKLKDYDAAIATGSNQTSVHFEWYFRHVPHIIRRNRNSVAVITGEETAEELVGLGKDIFSYFGLGCRNVSMLLVPEGYAISSLFDNLQAYSEVIHHHKYKNNFDYNLALFLLNKEPFLHNDFFILKESDSLLSRIGVIHWHEYKNIDQAIDYIHQHRDSIQCVVSGSKFPDITTVQFGHSQCPGIRDFADATDTIQFLLGLP